MSRLLRASASSLRDKSVSTSFLANASSLNPDSLAMLLAAEEGAASSSSASLSFHPGRVGRVRRGGEVPRAS